MMGFFWVGEVKKQTGRPAAATWKKRVGCNCEDAFSAIKIAAKQWWEETDQAGECELIMNARWGGKLWSAAVVVGAEVFANVISMHPKQDTPDLPGRGMKA